MNYELIDPRTYSFEGDNPSIVVCLYQADVRSIDEFDQAEWQSVGWSTDLYRLTDTNIWEALHWAAARLRSDWNTLASLSIEAESDQPGELRLGLLNCFGTNLNAITTETATAVQSMIDFRKAARAGNHDSEDFQKS